jgi:triphosphatase
MVEQKWLRRENVLEVEAKFRIPDEEVFRRLLDATALAGFRFDELSVVRCHDRYQDTVGRAIWAAGYAYRMRRQGERYTATLKGLGCASGGIHRRLEYETSLPAPCPPRMWPPGPVRDLALRLCDDELLVPLFEVDQIRHVRPVMEHERTVAEYSLERVSVRRDKDLIAAYLELEVELLPQGSEEDLERLAGSVKDVWGLEPEDQSKFERAWVALGLGVVSRQEAD